MIIYSFDLEGMDNNLWKFRSATALFFIVEYNSIDSDCTYDSLLAIL